MSHFDVYMASGCFAYAVLPRDMTWTQSLSTALFFFFFLFFYFRPLLVFYPRRLPSRPRLSPTFHGSPRVTEAMSLENVSSEN